MPQVVEQIQQTLETAEKSNQPIEIIEKLESDLAKAQAMEEMS